MPTVGFTALHYAVLAESEETIRALLKGGANPSKKDVKGNSPLGYATEEQQRFLGPLFEGSPSILLLPPHPKQTDLPLFSRCCKVSFREKEGKRP